MNVWDELGIVLGAIAVLSTLGIWTVRSILDDFIRHEFVTRVEMEKERGER